MRKLMMQHIDLIRHGATMANEQNLYCGKSDLPLSPQGRETLVRLAGQGGYPLPAGKRLCVSGLLRARQTLEVLYPGEAYEVLPAFREIDFGDFELQSYDQLKLRPDYQQWLTGDNARNRCPNGESGEDVANRVRPAFQALLEDGRDTVLVTHGGVIAAIMTDLYPDSMNSRYEWQGEPGHGWSVTFSDGKPVKCEPIPDPFLNQEKTLDRRWNNICLGLVGAGLAALLGAPYSAMRQTGREILWAALAAGLLLASQILRGVKLRCPYCKKSVAPLRLAGGRRLACPRCGRIYRYGAGDAPEEK